MRLTINEQETVNAHCQQYNR